MVLLKYVRYVKHKQTESENVFKLPTNVSALSRGELKEVNSQVSEVAKSKSLSSTCISRARSRDSSVFQTWYREHVTCLKD